jgi:2-C-methyl-D-erythritol 4-phosphate cytidylyltransferase
LKRKEHVIIVAGGRGSRMGSEIPKQFIELQGKPILLHTIEAFLRYSSLINIVVVLPGEEVSNWEALASKHFFKGSVTIVTGGPTRFRSVKNGLQKVDDGLVAIHDGVRPLVDSEIIRKGFDVAEQHGSAIASVPLKDSIRLIYPGSSKAVDRTSFRLIQTPQIFQTSLIKTAYAAQEDTGLTDDASVAERAGQQIHLYEGSFRNLKITTPEDLAAAEVLLRAGSKP